MSDSGLKTIAVDVTPLLPGGQNGGARIFVLALLRALAEMYPGTRFILLTQAATHDELASLDRANVSRRMVVGPAVATTLRPRLENLARRALPHLPVRLRGWVMGAGYRLHRALKRGGTGTLLRGMGADLLFCPFTAPTYSERDIPTVCTLYDFQYKDHPEFFAPGDVIYRARTFADACERADAFAAISEYSREAAIRHGDLGPRRVRAIHLRMARRIVTQAEQDKTILDRLGLAPQRYLVYPANFWKHKNHEMLLTAFGIACHDGLAADVKLVCTGEANERGEWLRRAATAMGLGDRVLFPGYLADAGLAALVARSGGVVFPSLYEGFGLPVIEAMAAGVPVACSNTTALVEMAGDAAILFDPRIPAQLAGAMRTLIEDQATRAARMEAGLAQAAAFVDTGRMAREYMELFHSALAGATRQ